MKSEVGPKLSHFLRGVVETFAGGAFLMLAIGAVYHDFALLRPIGYWKSLALWFFILSIARHSHHHSWDTDR